MRSVHNPLVPSDGKRFGDPGTTLNATVSTVGTQRKEDLKKPSSKRVAAIRKQARAHHARAASRANPLPVLYDDVYVTSNLGDEKKHLQDFAIQLANEPLSRAHIVIYCGPGDTQNTIHRSGKRARRYLIDSGINPKRIVLSNGGSSELPIIELWIQPNGYSPPPAFLSQQRCKSD
jgi:hypothetical protein